MEKTEKKDFIVNKREEDKDQTCTSRMDSDKCKRAREGISLSKSSISKSERLRKRKSNIIKIN